MLIAILIIGAILLYLYFETKSHKKSQEPLRKEALFKYIFHHMHENLKDSLKKPENKNKSLRESIPFIMELNKEFFNYQSYELSKKYDVSEFEVQLIISACANTIEREYLKR